MFQITVKIDKAGLTRLFKKLDDIAPAKAGRIIINAWRQATLHMEGKLKYAAGGGILKRRTGRLANSITSKIETRKGHPVYSIIGSGVRTGNRLPYANIHETGGTIRPKRGKFLAIPIRAGSPEAINMGLWKKRGGGTKKPIAFSSKVLQIMLVKKVKIPARHYMSKTASREGPAINRILKDEIAKGLES